MQIKLNYLKASNVASSDDPHRPWLAGVLVSVISHHVEYVATDGHRLIALRHELSTDSPLVWPAAGIIVPSALIESVKIAKRVGDIAKITIDGNSVNITYLGDTFTMPAVDGTFPDWRRIVPETCSGEIARFNAQYLADFTKAAKIMGHKIECPLIGHNGHNPALIDFLGGSTGTGIGVLMPRRESGQPPQCPSWIRPQATAQDAVAT